MKLNRKKTTRVRCFSKFWTNFHKLSSVMVSPFYSLSPCTHTYATTPPKLLPAFFGAPRTSGFANVIRHVAHSSIRGSRYRCFRNWQKESFHCIFLSSIFKTQKIKCPAWWGRPQRQVGLSWARLGHKSGSSQQHAGSGSSFLERCSVRTIALLLELIYQVRTKSGEVFGQLTAACRHRGIQIICYTCGL